MFHGADTMLLPNEDFAVLLGLLDRFNKFFVAAGVRLAGLPFDRAEFDLRLLRRFAVSEVLLDPLRAVQCGARKAMIKSANGRIQWSAYFRLEDNLGGDRSRD